MALLTSPPPIFAEDIFSEKNLNFKNRKRKKLKKLTNLTVLANLMIHEQLEELMDKLFLL